MPSSLILLHAGYAGRVRDIVLAVVSLASVVMAWYGVNFVVGGGLHSSGFGSGDNVWVHLVGLLNIDLGVFASGRYLYFQPRATKE